MTETIRQFANSENIQLRQKNMKRIQGKLQRTSQFIQDQQEQEEQVLQAFVMTNEERIQGEDHYYQRLRLIYYHLSNITVLSIDQMTFSAENKTIIHDALFQLANMLESDQPQQ